jgi:DNA gyrase inhibitor GyrI
MEQLKLWAKASNLMNDNTVIFGIAQDDPKTTLSENCRYDACILITDNSFKASGDVLPGQISGGKYAVFTVEHTAQAVAQAWANIFDVLRTNNCRYDSTRPILERYTAARIAKQLCEICVPVI